MTHLWKLLLSLTVTLSLTFLVACGSEDEGTPDDETSALPKITGAVQLDPVPEGAPKNVSITGYESLPPAGPPNVIISMIAAPEFTNGLYTISIGVEEANAGTYFMSIAVYLSDSVTNPEAGVDYVGYSSSAFEIGAADVDIGTVTAVPYVAPGG